MNSPLTALEQLHRPLTAPTRGILGLVDDLLALSCEQGMQLDWQAGHCRVRLREGNPAAWIEVPLRKAVVRAALARIAVLCNQGNPNSVSPYGGKGELLVGTNPATPLSVEFVNTPDEQRLELRSLRSEVMPVMPEAAFETGRRPGYAAGWCDFLFRFTPGAAWQGRRRGAVSDNHSRDRAALRHRKGRPCPATASRSPLPSAARSRRTANETGVLQPSHRIARIAGKVERLVVDPQLVDALARWPLCRHFQRRGFASNSVSCNATPRPQTRASASARCPARPLAHREGVVDVNQQQIGKLRQQILRVRGRGELEHRAGVPARSHGARPAATTAAAVASARGHP